LAIDASAHESLFQQVGKQVAIFPFLTANERCEDLKARTCGQFQYARQDLFARLPGYAAAAARTIRLTYAGIQHS
jgi:hypothetical protein